jgi:hypothetical protein
MKSSTPSTGRRRLFATGAAFALLTAGLTVASDPAAAVSCSGLSGDVNGDGHAEVAVGEPGDLVREACSW